MAAKPFVDSECQAAHNSKYLQIQPITMYSKNFI